MVLIHEIHPFSEMLPFDNNDIENSSLDYAGGKDYIAKTQYWFVHTISSLVMALINNGLTIEYFSEYCKDLSAGHKKQEELDAKFH